MPLGIAMEYDVNRKSSTMSLEAESNRHARNPNRAVPSDAAESKGRGHLVNPKSVYIQLLK